LDTYNFQKNIKNPIKSDLIIIDESSMIDMDMMFNLLRACKDNLTLLFVGDENQIPSVNYGDIFNSLIKTNYIPCTLLTKIFRQGEGSIISLLAKHIIKQVIPSIQVMNDKEKNETQFINIKDNTYNDILKT
jgi:exodeoxyribonuclease V alpha subunit